MGTINEGDRDMGKLKDVNYILVGESRDRHLKDDEGCGYCWSNHPAICKCGGLIHANCVGHSKDGFDLRRACDTCGDNYEYSTTGKERAC